MAMLTPLVFAILGAILASFAGVISERLHTGQSWTKGRSRCNSCNRMLTVGDLVPFFSWALSMGRCRTCNAKVPYLYALAELSLGALYFATVNAFGITPASVLLLWALFFLTIVVLYDLRHTIVPMNVAMLLFVTALGSVVLEGYDLPTLSGVFLLSGGIGLGFFLLHFLSRGKWMGLGDAPIALSLALLAGTHAFSGLLFSFWVGGAIGICILVSTRRGHRMGIEVPFVPFLAAGFLLALFTQWNPILF